MESNAKCLACMTNERERTQCMNLHKQMEHVQARIDQLEWVKQHEEMSVISSLSRIYEAEHSTCHPCHTPSVDDERKERIEVISAYLLWTLKCLFRPSTQ
eukprot:1038830_1